MMLGVIQNTLEEGVGNIIIETRLSMSEELLVAGWQVMAEMILKLFSLWLSFEFSIIKS